MGRAIVIGAGVIGASVTYHLARAGMAVDVFDAGRPGGGTSGATFAWVNAVDRTPEHYFRLSYLAMAAHRSLQTELGRRWQHGEGMIEWAEDRDARDRLAARMQRLRDWGYPVEQLTVDEVHRDIEPHLMLDDRQIPWVARFPDDRWVHPSVLIGALLEAAGKAGARVHVHTAITGVERVDDRITAVTTEAGDRVDADVVVNCAGPSAAEVGRWFGVDLPMHRKPGLILVTEPAPTELRGVVRTPGLELRSDGGGRVLANALFTEPGLDQGPAPSIDAPVCQEALERVRRLVRGMDGVGLESARLGQRPMPDDRRPLVGPVTGVTGAYTVATHSGISLAPLLGRLVAQEIAHGRTQPELEELRLDRR